MSDVIAIGKKNRYRFATGGKLILFKHNLLSSILVIKRVIVIENKQKFFQLQLQLSTFENFQLQLQQNHVITLLSITIIIFPSPVNTNFNSLRKFRLTWNLTTAYRFSSRCSNHSTTVRFLIVLDSKRMELANALPNNL